MWEQGIVLRPIRAHGPRPDRPIDSYIELAPMRKSDVRVTRASGDRRVHEAEAH